MSQECRAFRQTGIDIGQKCYADPLSVGRNAGIEVHISRQRRCKGRTRIVLVNYLRSTNRSMTSRARLSLSSEHEFPLPPLAVPEMLEQLDREALLQFGAIAFFLQRAQAIKPDFQLTADNAQAVTQICAQLDGLPLSLELAASRIKLLPPTAMLARLEHRLSLLTSGPIDLPARQQSLRQTLDWSYNLLELGEQRILRRLGIFVGGCSLDAVEALANLPGDLPLDVISQVAALIDKSLVHQREQPDGHPRLSMLETTREYALEQLQASGEEAIVRCEHARYYLRLAQTAESSLPGREQRVWLDRLDPILTYFAFTRNAPLQQYVLPKGLKQV